MDAYVKSTTPTAEKDEQSTPPSIVARIQQVLGVTIEHDVCATEKNCVVPNHWNRADDSLSFSWANGLCVDGRLPFLWMNPPYSQLPEWTEKASEEARKGNIVIGLVPDMRSSTWYRRYVDAECCTVYIPDGRVNFLGVDGKPRPGNPLPSCFPIWTPWRPGSKGAQYPYFSRKGKP